MKIVCCRKKTVPFTEFLLLNDNETFYCCDDLNLVMFTYFIIDTMDYTSHKRK